MWQPTEPARVMAPVRRPAVGSRSHEPSFREHQYWGNASRSWSLGLYGDNEKENGNYYAIIGFRVEGLGIEDGGCLQLCVQNVPLGGSLSVAATQCRTGKRSRCRPLWISNSTDTASAQGLGFRVLHNEIMI